MIKDMHLELPKNAKLFYNEELQTYYAVHYNHVVLIVTENKKILDIYPASQTSCDVIRRVGYFLDMQINPLRIYNELNNTDIKKVSELYNWGYQQTGYYSPDRFKKSDWSMRESRLAELEPRECIDLRY